MTARRGRATAGVLLALLVTSVFTSAGRADAAPAAAVPSPTLSSPPAGTRGHALWDSYYDLAPFGYEDEEFLVSGTATDAAGNTAPYTTRMIVTRPTDAARFNGTVVLDWVNVSAQFENAVDTMLTREMLVREGFAYVHVSAQAVGLTGLPLLTPTLWDVDRYAAIDHPGDAWAFDMFTQVAQSFRTTGTPDPMGTVGLDSVQAVIAVGQSQSGIRLHDYVETWLPAHPDAAGLIDGFLVHGDVGKDKDFGTPPVPVLQLLSDLEAADDGVDPATFGPNQRLWEVAGSSHADLFIGYQSIAGHGPRSQADAPRVSPEGFQAIIDTAGNYGEQIDPLLGVCTAAGAAMPMHYAASAALYSLDQWVKGGAPPDNGPRFEFAAGAQAKDEHGNSLGGIRLPPIDVPVASYVSTSCGLGGITVPFSDVQIQALYPTHADYLAQMAERSDAAVRAGWMLPEDATDLMRRACAASNRWLPGQAACADYTPPEFRAAVASAPTPMPAPAAVSAPAPAGIASTPPSSTLPATGGATAPWLVGALLVGLVMIRCVAAALRLSSPSR